jgi:hypothetical protein
LINKSTSASSTLLLETLGSVAASNPHSIIPLETWQVVRELAFVWHPESLDTCDDHFGTICQFRDSRKPSWITSITLLHWSLTIKPVAAEDGSKAASRKFSFPLPFQGKKHSKIAPRVSSADPKAPFPFPPDDIDGFLGQKHWAEQFCIDEDELAMFRPHLELNSSSVVISTSPFGDFGKCSVLSRAVEEAVHLRLSKIAIEVSNAFIHQPHTARCLIFMLYLGAICDAIALQYEDILKCLDKPLGLGVGCLRLCSRARPLADHLYRIASSRMVYSGSTDPPSPLSTLE